MKGYLPLKISKHTAIAKAGLMFTVRPLGIYMSRLLSRRGWAGMGRNLSVPRMSHDSHVLELHPSSAVACWQVLEGRYTPLCRCLVLSPLKGLCADCAVSLSLFFAT